MNSEKIEVLAVNYLKETISYCPLLSAADVKEGDKEISWDGFIRIHNTSNHSGGNLVGRVFVQIKGHKSENLSNENIKYKVKVSDLNNYLHDGGAVYIVVYINGRNKKIYYETLNVVKLKDYLCNVKDNQKYKNIKLRSLPLDESKIQDIFINFEKESKKQKSFVYVNLPSIGEMLGRKDLTGFSFGPAIFGNGKVVYEDLLALMKDEVDVSVYAHLKDFDIPIPTSDFNPKITIQSEIDKPVTINNVVYFSKFYFFQCEFSKIVVKICNGFYYMINEDGPSTINYTVCRYHKDRLTALDFMYNACVGNGFKLGDFEVNFSDEDVVEINLDKVRKEIDFLRKMDRLLESLNVSEQIDMDNFTNEDYNNVSLLYRCIVDDLPIFDYRGDACYYNLKISNLTFKILLYPVKKDGDKEQQFKICDFYSKNKHLLLFENNGEKYYFPTVFLISQDDLLNISNIDYNYIVETYLEYLHKYENLFRDVNELLLHLLLVYDKNNKRIILEAAEKLAKGILNCNISNLNCCALRINYYQVIKRNRVLNENEENCLLNYRENPDVDYICKTAICLLLDDGKGAKYYYNKLSQEEKSCLMEMPIYRFGGLLENNES
ncbi:MAG: DUF4365 domain-containing protein [Bacteroidales bacterium]|nr:DUF4365 domain-containing protein [Bacteroidales bacterium]